MNAFQKYLEQLPAERVEAVQLLRKTFLNNLPKGFAEIISEKSIDYVVPHSIYPDGYHCNPKQALPFISIVSQKNVLTIHHLGFYASQELSDWFSNEYSKHITSKLDMGKGCVKFKKMEHIPYELIGELSRKITVEDWIKNYERILKKNKD